MGLLERVILALSAMTETRPPVNIIEFAEGPEYLGQNLYFRQRLLLKIYYKIPLNDEELADARWLLAADQKYAKLYVPGIRPHEAYELSDAELQERLLGHYAHVLEVIGGRRGSK